MSRNLRITRSMAIVRLQRQLERDSFPRIQMGLIVTLTGAMGWLCSFGLLRSGMGNMALRYPLALGGAYVFFLLLLWLWLRSSADSYADLSDGLDMVDMVTPDYVGDMPSAPGVLSSVGDAVGSGADADELAIPILALVLALGLALASLYVVYLAPALFAELLFDGVLSYTLYRRLRNANSSHWLSTAFSRTVLPFALTAVFLMLVGWALAAYAPGAHSLPQALHAAKG
jgi:hypothetical protein